MTTDQLAKRVAAAIKRMTPNEKFRVQAVLDKAFPPKRWLN